jgi:hypothetical protein
LNFWKPWLKKLVAALGGKCQICDYDKTIRNLAFHHLRDKKFSLSSRGFQYSEKKILSEAAKCVLVCHNCHGEIHDGLIDESILTELNLVNIAVLKDFHLF